MRLQRLGTPSDTLAIVFDKGDRVMEGLADLARRENIRAARFTGIGAFSGAEVGVFDRQKRGYETFTVDGATELLGILGDIAWVNDEPAVHAHVALGRADGSALGGHLIEATVFPTLELFLTIWPSEIAKSHDEETDLNLFDLPEEVG